MFIALNMLCEIECFLRLFMVDVKKGITLWVGSNLVDYQGVLVKFVTETIEHQSDFNSLSVECRNRLSPKPCRNLVCNVSTGGVIDRT